jgi:hypothetical protein
LSSFSLFFSTGALLIASSLTSTVMPEFSSEVSPFVSV